MSDDLRACGIHILGELAEAWDEKAWSAVKAWERNCISAYPDLEDLGPITPDERTYAEGLVQQQAPDFTITHPSTYFLDAETIEATAFTNAVRLHRLQHSNVKRKSKAGRKPIPDEKILAAINRVVAGQPKPNYNKAIIEVLDGMGIDSEELETVYERIKKKIYPLEK